MAGFPQLPAPRLRTPGIASIAFALVVVSASRAPAGPAYFAGVGDLPGGATMSQALGVSGDGSTVVGWSYSHLSSEGFRWTAKGGIEGLGINSTASAASWDGTIVVGGIGGQACFWRVNEGVTPLGTLPGGASSGAVDISASGSLIAGTSGSAVGNQPFLWTSEGMSGLGHLPGYTAATYASALSGDGSTVVGTGYSATTHEAFRWKDGVMIGLGNLSPSHLRSNAFATSADGSTVVGRSDNASGLGEAYRWTEVDGMVALGLLPGAPRPYLSEALAVSGDGSVIVGGSNTGAFIWNDRFGMRDLQFVLQDVFTLDLTGWTLESATGVSADGRTIVGRAFNPAGNQEGWIAHIPEPSMATLLGLLALLGVQSGRTGTQRGRS